MMMHLCIKRWCNVICQQEKCSKTFSKGWFSRKIEIPSLIMAIVLQLDIVPQLKILPQLDIVLQLDIVPNFDIVPQLDFVPQLKILPPCSQALCSRAIPNLLSPVSSFSTPSCNKTLSPTKRKIFEFSKKNKSKLLLPPINIFSKQFAAHLMSTQLC